MDLDLEYVVLMMGTHSCARNSNNDRWEWVEASGVAWGLGYRMVSCTGVPYDRGIGQEATNGARLEAHSDQSSKPKHDGNANMLNLFGGVWVAGFRTEALHPSICSTVKEDNE